MNKLDICHKSGSNDHKMILIWFSCSELAWHYLAGKAASWFPSDSSGHVRHSSWQCRSCPYCFQQLFPRIQNVHSGLHLAQITIMRGQFSAPLTRTVTMLGCWAFRIVLISLKEVMGKPSFSFSIFNLFKATISSENVKLDSVFHTWNGHENTSWTCLFSYPSFCPWLCTPRRMFPPLFGSNTGIPQRCGNPEGKQTV